MLQEEQAEASPLKVSTTLLENKHLRVRLDKTQRGAFEEFIAAARAVPEVVTIQTLLGRVDVRMDVIARDLKHYEDILKTKIMDLPHIADVEALMLISEVKNDPWLAI